MDKNHSNIGFSAVHYGISEIEGEFKDYDGIIISSSDDFNGVEIEFTAKVASITTDNERRDEHLQSDDFFNVEKYPEMKFKGKIQKQGKKLYLVRNFTVQDITKPIKFDVKYNGTVPVEKSRKARFKITGVLDRFEYGLKYDKVIEKIGLTVSKEIQIICNFEINEQVGE